MGTSGSHPSSNSTSGNAFFPSRSSSTRRSQEQQLSSPSSSTTTCMNQFARRAHHAGSWYESSFKELDAVLTEYFHDAQEEYRKSISLYEKKEKGEDKSRLCSATSGACNGNATNSTTTAATAAAAATPSNPSTDATVVLPPRAIIAPHAGYRYSGPTAAYAYHALREALISSSSTEEANKKSVIKTIVVLHPSHHVRLDGCAVSGASYLETPIDNLPVDDDLRTELLNTGNFTIMERHVDEQEHSGEMQYPFIAKALREAQASRTKMTVSVVGSKCSTNAISNKKGDSTTGTGNAFVRVLPIMVGALSTNQEKFYGQLLAPILARDEIFTIISSDFCHWGRRFGYMPHNQEEFKTTTERQGKQPKQQIFEYIEWLDRMGMDQIELQDPGAFARYLHQYSNTICGRHPIGVWLHAVMANREGDSERLEIKFIRYAQSGQVRSTRDSSVSYASAVARRVVDGPSSEVEMS